eukprot:scaffold16416_cov52-Attheya_sp.AAC.17
MDRKKQTIRSKEQTRSAAMVDFDTNGDCDDGSAVPLGDIGYTFCKLFTGYGLFDGTVVKIRPGAGKLADELNSTHVDKKRVSARVCSCRELGL